MLTAHIKTRQLRRKIFPTIKVIFTKYQVSNVQVVCMNMWNIMINELKLHTVELVFLYRWEDLKKYFNSYPMI